MRRPVLVLFAVAITAVLLARSAAPVAHACTCVQTTVEERVAQSEVIAIGTILASVLDDDPSGNLDWDARVAVERYLAGSGPTEVVADDPPDGGSCGVFDASHVGQRYVIFFYDDFKTHLCMGDEPATDEFVASVELAVALSPPGALPETGGPPDSGQGLDRTLIGMAGTLALVSLLAAAYLWPIRSSLP